MPLEAGEGIGGEGMCWGGTSPRFQKDKRYNMVCQLSFKDGRGIGPTCCATS